MSSAGLSLDDEYVRAWRSSSSEEEPEVSDLSSSDAPASSSDSEDSEEYVPPIAGRTRTRDPTLSNSGSLGNSGAGAGAAAGLPAGPKKAQFKVEQCDNCGQKRVVGVEYSSKGVRKTAMYPSDRGERAEGTKFTCAGPLNSDGDAAFVANGDSAFVEHRCNQAPVGYLIRKDHIKNKKPVSTVGNVYADLSALFTFVQACGGADVMQSVLIPGTVVKAPGHIAASLGLITSSRASAIVRKYRTVFLTPGKNTRRTLEAQLLDYFSTNKDDRRTTFERQQNVCRGLLGIAEDDVSLAREITNHQKIRGVCVDLKNSDQLHQIMTEIETTADGLGFASTIAELRSTNRSQEHVALLGESAVGKSSLLSKLILASADFRHTSDARRGRCAAEQLADAIVSGKVIDADEEFDDVGAADSEDESTSEEADGSVYHGSFVAAAPAAAGNNACLTSASGGNGASFTASAAATVDEAGAATAVAAATAAQEGRNKFTFALDAAERKQVIQTVTEYDDKFPLLLPTGAVGQSTTASVVRVQQGDRFSVVVEFYTEAELRKLVWDGLEALDDENDDSAESNADFLLQFFDTDGEMGCSDDQSSTDIVRQHSASAKSQLELNLRKDLMEVAGAVLVVPGSSTTDSRADYLVARYVLHCAQGMVPDGWCPAQPTTSQKSPSLALLGPFEALLSGDSGRAADYGMLVLPALKHITVFTCSRLPLRLLPMFDLPGCNDPDFAKEQVLERELKRTAFILVIIENNTPSKEVIAKLASWAPLQNWKPPNPLPFALVTNVSKRSEFDKLEGLQERRAKSKSKKRERSEKEPITPLERAARAVVQGLVARNCWASEADGNDQAHDAINQLKKAAIEELSTNGRGAFEPAINNFLEDMQALTSKTPSTVAADDESPHELDLLFGMLSERSRRNAEGRLEKCLRAIDTSSSAIETNPTELSVSAFNPTIVMNDHWRQKEVKKIALTFSRELDSLLSEHSMTIAAIKPDAAVQAAQASLISFIEQNFDNLKSAVGGHQELKHLPLVDSSRRNLSTKRADMARRDAEKRLRSLLCAWDEAVDELLRTELLRLHLKRFNLLLKDELHKRAGKFADNIGQLIDTSWNKFKDKCQEARKCSAVDAYNGRRWSVRGVSQVCQVGQALEKNFDIGIAEVRKRFENTRTFFVCKVLGKSANDRGRCLTNTVFKDAVQAHRDEAGSSSVSRVEVLESLRKQLQPAIKEARNKAISREELGNNILADIRSLRVQDSVASLDLLGPHASLAPPMDVTGPEHYEMFNPDKHLDKLTNLKAETKQWVEPLSSYVRSSYGVSVEVPAKFHIPSSNFDMIFALTNVKTWGESDQRTRAKVRNDDLRVLVRAWSHLLRDRDPAIKASWNRFPEWLQQLVVMANAYGRPINLIVPNTSASALDVETPATIIHFSVLHPHRIDASDTILFFGSRNNKPILLPCDSSGTKSHALARHASAAMDESAVDNQQEERCEPDIAEKTHPITLVSPVVVRRWKLPVLHLGAWQKSRDDWSIDYKDPTNMRERNAKTYGLSIGDFKTLAADFLSFGEFCSSNKPKTSTGKSEDAVFINWHASVAGVFDGVGSLRESGDWSRCVASVIGSAADGPLGQYLGKSHDPNRARGIVDEGLSRTNEDPALHGATTGVVFALAKMDERHELHWVSWGDSIGAVFRNGECIFVTPVTYIQGAARPNTPVQLESPCRNGEPPRGVKQGTIPVQPGDILVLASDGLTDNLDQDRWNSESCLNITDRQRLCNLLTQCAINVPCHSAVQLRDSLVKHLQQIMNGDRGKKDDAAVVAIELCLGEPLEQLEFSSTNDVGATEIVRLRGNPGGGTKRLASGDADSDYGDTIDNRDAILSGPPIKRQRTTALLDSVVQQSATEPVFSAPAKPRGLRVAAGAMAYEGGLCWCDEPAQYRGNTADGDQVMFCNEHAGHNGRRNGRD